MAGGRKKTADPEAVRGWRVLLGWLALLPGALSILYGLVVAAARSGSRFYLVWLAFGVFWLFAVPAARRGLWKRLWAQLPRIVRALFLACCASSLLLFLLVEGLVLSRFGEQGPEDLDYLIVLGAQIHRGGPSTVLKYRLDKAAEYLAENPGTICIVSGGRGTNEHAAEAVVMREYLLSLGISSDRILAEAESRNTIENIRNSFSLFDPASASVGIVTSNFHVYRGTAIARRQGGTEVYGISAPSHPRFLLSNLVREFVGVMKDFLCGNI